MRTDTLFVLNSSLIRSLPGVDIIPPDGNRAFFALAPRRDVSDLERSVIQLRGKQLQQWRQNPALRFHGKAIIVVETAAATRVKKRDRRPADGQADVEPVPFADRRRLIVVDPSVIRSLPGVEVISLGGPRAFLALAPGCAVSDLELAVIDRMARPPAPGNVRRLPTCARS